MSSPTDRIQQVIDRLKTQFEGMPYYLKVKEREDSPYAWNFAEVPETKDDLLLSVIIPARNEFPNVVHTVHSILNCWEADGYDYKNIEIIIVDNCSSERHASEDKFFSHPVDQGTSSYLEGRGIFFTGVVKTHYYPLAGNHTARNRGAEIARGKYLMISDAHMSYRPGFFKYMLESCEKYGGIIHSAVAWMGTYPPASPSIGMQYTLKLGDEPLKGTWAPYASRYDGPFYIFGQGHCSLVVSRKQFLEFGGYNEYSRTYGGGEWYMNSKWWMFGSTVMVEPRAIGYHLKSFRGYSWSGDDYKHNALNISYALGADEWRERGYISYLRTGRKEILDDMIIHGELEMKRDREFISKKRIKTFNELLLEMPWNKMNKENLNLKPSGSMLIYHPTWFELLKNQSSDQAKEAYRSSKYQAQLDKFIRENLWNFVYHKDKYSVDKPLVL